MTRNPEGNRKRRGPGIRNLVVFSIAVSALPGVAHAFQPPERSSSPTAGHVDQSPVKQRVPRPHGGPKIAAPAIVGSRQPAPVENMRAQSPRGSARGSANVHRLYTSGKVRPENISYRPFARNVTQGQQRAILGLGKPLETSNRKDKKEETIGIRQLLSLLEKVAPSEAQMLNDTLRQVINDRIPNISIGLIQQQALEILNKSIVRMVQKASPADLAHLAAFDFSGVTNAKLAKLVNPEDVPPQQLQLAHSVIGKIKEGVKLDEPPNKILDRVKDLLPLIPAGAVLATILGITAAAATSLIKKDAPGFRASTSFTLLLVNLALAACGTIPTPAVDPTAILATNTPAPTEELIATSSETPFPDIGITPSPSENSTPSDIIGLNTLTGAIPGVIFAQNNPGYQIIQPPQQAYEVPINKYVNPRTGNTYEGSVIQASYLMELFGTQDTPDKNGLFHGSWNGQAVTFTGDFKFLVTQGGQKIPLGLPGNWGYTVLFERDGRLFLGSTDGNYLLQSFMIPLTGVSENEISQKLKEFLSFIAGNSGGVDQTIMNKAADFKFSGQGYLILLDGQGNELAYTSNGSPRLDRHTRTNSHPNLDPDAG